jgi:glutathione S-transferase
MALRRIGVEHRTIDCKSSQEVRRIDSGGRVPVLEIDGKRIADSIAILDELERRFPESDLFPTDARIRTRDRLWEHFANDHLYWTGFYLRWVDPQMRALFYRKLFGSMPIPTRWFVRSFLFPAMRKRAVGQGIASRSTREVVRSIERSLEMVETGLEGGPYLQARERPGRGDLACASILAQVGFRGTMPAVEKQVRARPAVLEQIRRVFEACALDPPHWLRRAC